MIGEIREDPRFHSARPAEGSSLEGNLIVKLESLVKLIVKLDGNKKNPPQTQKYTCFQINVS